MHLAREIPREGQIVKLGDWQFEVIDMDGNRVDKVLAVHLTSTNTSAAENAHEDTYS
jgi:CBS domain containing-hemolysin-like protein